MQKGEREVRCVAVYLPTGVELRLLDAGELRRTQARHIDPMLALDSRILPVGPEWSYEVRRDGYRALLHKNADHERLWSRLQCDPTKSYPSAQLLPRRATAAIDDERVAPDAEGGPTCRQVRYRGAALGS